MLAIKPKTKILVDGGDPEETLRVKQLLGFVDGQTTNPSLIAKNPEIRERIASGHSLSPQEEKDEYRKIVQNISPLVGDAGVSIEVFADLDTKAEEMLAQGEEMFSWIPNAYIKYPCTREGLRAAEMSVARQIRVNMTLCFSQEQAAAVYAATRGSREPAYVSPFIGRLDDHGENGIDLIKNIKEMYKNGDGHVYVLAASIRTSIICSLHLRPALSSRLFPRRSWCNGPQKTFQCRIKTSATKLLMRVASPSGRFRTRRWISSVRGRALTPRMNSQPWAFRSLWLIIGAPSDAQDREAGAGRSSDIWNLIGRP
jgi:transaldolase